MHETVEFSSSNLRVYRKARKLTIKKLAQDSGVAERYIYMLEHGDKKNPTLNILRHLGRTLNILFY